MYRPALDARLAAAGVRPGTARARQVGPTVWLLGVTSLFTDVSAEMVTSVLPAYLLVHQQVSPALFGALDGLQQGGAALARLAGGAFTDRSRRYTEIALCGYAVSALCRIGLPLAGSSGGALAGVIALDRLGKGIRAAPRDALISLSVGRSALGAAFGVHRTLDTFGAMLGPLLAYAVLRATGNDYGSVFVVSTAAALIGVSVIAGFVRNPAQPADGGLPPLRWSDYLPRLAGNRRLVIVAAIAAAFGVAAVSDSLIYLALQQGRGMPVAWIPLLFVATPASFSVWSWPLGRLADRVGRGPVVIGGYVALLAAYAGLLVPASAPAAAGAVVVFLGAYYAATDGVLTALAGSLLPRDLRASGLAVVGTCHDVGRLAASVIFGWVWAMSTADAAVRVFLVLLAAVLLGAAPALLRVERSVG